MRRLDAVGVLVSGICAVHCVVVALFLAAVPLAGATFISDPRVELTFVASALVIGFVSLGLGFWRVHRDERPMIAFAVGSLFLMGLRPMASESKGVEAAIVVLGAVAIIAGHLWNRRLLHRHAVCGGGHSHQKPHAI
ncbi:MAG: MerC domain-containing protein [Gemmatimonadaceae bacterium]|nr:MerC domain-containing protein [Gemmatimonadaceae bacterium]